MGLGRFDESSGLISFNVLLRTIGYTGKGYDEKWIESKEFPIIRKRIKKRSQKMVCIDQFWQWSETHMEVFNYARFPEGILGPEPSWVKEKRKSDVAIYDKKYGKEWTKKDDDYLIFLLNQYQYTIKEIADRMVKTEFAIERRIAKLNIKQRPVKASPIKWDDEKKELLKNMILRSRSYEEIADKIGCSAKAAKNKAILIFGTSNQDKIRGKLKNEK